MRKPLVYMIIMMMLIAALSLYRLDYYIVKPGHAYEVSEFIEVADSHKHQGTLNLMTVAMQVATPLSYALSWLDPTSEIVKKEQVRRQDESDKEYDLRQQKQMTDSQFNAKYVAYNKLGLKTKVNFEGLYVLHVVKDSAAYKQLQAGDEITQVDGLPVTSLAMFTEHIAPKKKGDEVALVILRDGKEQSFTIALKPIPEDAEERIGLGISYTAAQSLETTPPLEVSASDIGGPSAGLMFTLGIINALSEKDITKGYAVAGSGTMNLDGTVGPIGEIGKKVIAADRDGMDYFFALSTPYSEEYMKAMPGAKTNYEEALAMAKKINTTMVVVPVETVDDALNYLQQLNAPSTSR